MHHLRVVHLAGRHAGGVHEPAPASTPTCAFMPKYHWFPFFDDDISGSRFCCLFLVDGEAAISVASTIVPTRSISPFASRCSPTAAKDRLRQSVALEQVAEIQDRRLVRNLVAAEFQATERAH